MAQEIEIKPFHNVHSRPFVIFLGIFFTTGSFGITNFHRHTPSKNGRHIISTGLCFGRRLLWLNLDLAQVETTATNRVK